MLGADLVSSLSRPGGNTTGLTILSPELSAKRLEILSEIVPGLSRVAALWDPTSGNSQVSTTEIAARAKNIQLQVLKVQHRDDLAEAFAAARNAEAQALNIFASPFLSRWERSLEFPPHNACRQSTSGKSTLRVEVSCLTGQV